MNETKTPVFKEKDKKQFVYSEGAWVETEENLISALWHCWVTAKKVYRELDDDGFLVFGYVEIEEAKGVHIEELVFSWLKNKKEPREAKPNFHK